MADCVSCGLFTFKSTDECFRVAKEKKTVKRPFQLRNHKLEMQVV